MDRELRLRLTGRFALHTGGSRTWRARLSLDMLGTLSEACGELVESVEGLPSRNGACLDSGCGSPRGSPSRPLNSRMAHGSGDPCHAIRDGDLKDALGVPCDPSSQEGRRPAPWALRPATNRPVPRRVSIGANLCGFVEGGLRLWWPAWDTTASGCLGAKKRRGHQSAP